MVHAGDARLIEVELPVKPQPTRTHISDLQHSIRHHRVLHAGIELLEVRIPVVAVEERPWRTQGHADFDPREATTW